MFDDISILRGLAQLPAVPFREEHIAAYIAQEARRMGLEPQQDACGNILVHYRRGENAAAQPLAFVAHMDHPGLEIISVDGQRAQARLLGGVAAGYFEGHVPVQVHGPNGVTSGRVVAARTAEDRSSLVVDLALDGPAAAGDYAVWDMPAFTEDGDLLRMRAADDLAGCAAALSTLRELVRQDRSGDVYGVFTRAEEVGLIGASLVAQAGLLPANTVVVSLESSRTLPGAVAGEGPVIRVGDLRTTFHPEAEALFYEARRHLQEAEPGARVQRQLMSGGTCEATVFSVMGYRSTGLAFPLENYHNQGPDGALLPEAIHRRDFCTAVDLLVRLVQVAAQPFVSSLREHYARTSLTHRDRLIASAKSWTI